MGLFLNEKEIFRGSAIAWLEKYLQPRIPVCPLFQKTSNTIAGRRIVRNNNLEIGVCLVANLIQLASQ